MYSYKGHHMYERPRNVGQLMTAERPKWETADTADAINKTASL
jgi:hypothetical protein